MAGNRYIKSTFADERNIDKEYQIMSKAKSISLWLLCNPLTNLKGVPLPALAYPIKKRNKSIIHYTLSIIHYQLYIRTTLPIVKDNR